MDHQNHKKIVAGKSQQTIFFTSFFIARCKYVNFNTIICGFSRQRLFWIFLLTHVPIFFRAHSSQKLLRVTTKNIIKLSIFVSTNFFFMRFFQISWFLTIIEKQHEQIMSTLDILMR